MLSLLKPKYGSSAAYERYYFQFVIIGKCGLFERFAPYDNRIAFDRDALRVQVECRKQFANRQAVVIFGPLTVYLNSHRAIMHPKRQRVKTLVFESGKLHLNRGVGTNVDESISNIQQGISNFQITATATDTAITVTCRFVD